MLKPSAQGYDNISWYVSYQCLMHTHTYIMHTHTHTHTNRTHKHTHKHTLNTDTVYR